MLDQKPYEEEGQDVKQCNSPKDLFNRTGERLGGVFGLCSGQTNQFGSTKGKSGRDEDCTDSFESIGKGTRIVESPGTPVLIVLVSRWSASRTPKRFFSISIMLSESISSRGCVEDCTTGLEGAN